MYFFDLKCIYYSKLNILFNMKKIKILIVFILFGLSFLIHFSYEWIPSFITSVFSPVNESIWEHMKIIFTSTIISAIIEYFIYRNRHIEFNNLIISVPIISTIGILLYLSLYYLITMFVQQNMFINLSLLFIVYSFMQLVSYFLLNSEEIKYEKIIGVSVVIVLTIIFAYLTYNPVISNLFLDQENHFYGIKIKE